MKKAVTFSPEDMGVSLPALLRVARRTYGMAMYGALKNNDCGDVPKNGLYVIGGLSRTQTPLEDLIKQLGVSKQSASQLVDSLVNRGYLERTSDSSDRRRMNINLTERGKLAADIIASESERIDIELIDLVGKQKYENTKETLAALIDINDKRFNLPRSFR